VVLRELAADLRTRIERLRWRIGNARIMSALLLGRRRRRLESIDDLLADGSPQAVELLIDALNSRDGRMAAKAAAALGRLADPQALPALVRGLSDSRDFMRLACADALRQFGVEALELFREALSVPDETTQLTAIRALGHLGPMGAEILRDALDSPFEVVRQAATEELARLRTR
jgi:HEAT repeat protein